jgi:hypothetical protein
MATEQKRLFFLILNQKVPNEPALHEGHKSLNQEEYSHIVDGFCPDIDVNGVKWLILERRCFKIEILDTWYYFVLIDAKKEK